MLSRPILISLFVFLNLGGYGWPGNQWVNDGPVLVIHDHILKCLYSQQGLCGFGISITSENVFKPKN